MNRWVKRADRVENRDKIDIYKGKGYPFILLGE